MTKRRADDDDDATQPQAPSKRRAGLPCVATAAVRRPTGPPPPAAGPDVRRKRPRVWEEREQQRDGAAPSKKPCAISSCPLKNGSLLGRSGSFGHDDGMLSPCAGTPQGRPREGAALGHVTEAAETIPTEDDLSAFNSFQFWREPLPALDFSLLECGDGEPAKKTSTLLEGDAMEM